jgi:hypothetical protein
MIASGRKLPFHLVMIVGSYHSLSLRERFCCRESNVSEFDSKCIAPGIIDEQEYDGKPFRVFFAKDPYGVCFCFTPPLEKTGASETEQGSPR